MQKALPALMINLLIFNCLNRTFDGVVASQQPPLPSKAYLLYDVDPGEGFNFRKGCFHRIMSLANKLQQSHSDVKWVIVVPPFKDRNSQQFYPVGSFFDIATYEAGAFPAGRIIEAATFFAETGRKAIDRDIHFVPAYDAASLGPLLPRTMQEPHGTKHHVETGGSVRCPTASAQRHTQGFYMHHPPNDSNWDAGCVGDPKMGCSGGWGVFFGGTDWPPVSLSSLRCLKSGFLGVGDKRLRQLVLDELRAGHANNMGNPEKQTASSLSDSTISLLISGFDYLSPDQTESGDSEIFWHRRRALQYAPLIRKVAIDFMKASGLKDGQYIGFHWRRRDFQRFHPNEFNNVEDVAKTLAEKCVAFGVQTIFMATDTTAEEIVELHVRLHNASRVAWAATGIPLDTCPAIELLVLSTQPDITDGLNAMQIALVEQVVASRGIYFLGTQYSTFSREVHFERARHYPEEERFLENKEGSLSANGQVLSLCRGPRFPATSEPCEPWW